MRVSPPGSVTLICVLLLSEFCRETTRISTVRCAIGRDHFRWNLSDMAQSTYSTVEIQGGQTGFPDVPVSQGVTKDNGAIQSQSTVCIVNPAILPVNDGFPIIWLV